MTIEKIKKRMKQSQWSEKLKPERPVETIGMVLVVYATGWINAVLWVEIETTTDWADVINWVDAIHVNCVFVLKSLLLTYW